MWKMSWICYPICKLSLLILQQMLVILSESSRNMTIFSKRNKHTRFIMLWAIVIIYIRSTNIQNFIAAQSNMILFTYKRGWLRSFYDYLLLPIWISYQPSMCLVYDWEINFKLAWFYTIDFCQKCGRLWVRKSIYI